MIPVDERERIRRAYYVEQKSKRQIAREMGHSRATVDKAVEEAEMPKYQLTAPRSAPMLGPVKAQIDQWLADNETLPRKQRYTSHVIFTKLQADGFTGGESTVRGYIGRVRQARRRPLVISRLNLIPVATPRSIGARPKWSGRGTDHGAVVCHAVVLFAPTVCDGLSFPETRIVL